MATCELYEPTARLYPAFISTPRHLYLWGGSTVTFETGSEDARIQQARCIEQFDPYLEVWRQLSTTGTPHPGLASAACASVGDQVYMYGGGGKRYEGVLSLLSLKTLTWSQLCQEAGPMRKSSCGMVSFHGDQLAVIGGYGIPTGPTQHGASFIRHTNATDGVGWTNEVHIYNINQGIIILILHLSVSTSGRSREGHLTRAKKFSFSSSLDLDVTCSSSLTQLAMVLAATTVSRFKRAAG